MRLVVGMVVFAVLAVAGAVAAAVALTGEDDRPARGSSSSSSPAGESTDCRLAGTGWVREIRGAVTDARLAGAPVDVDAVEVKLDAVNVHCSPEVRELVAAAGLALAEGNALLRVCEVNAAACDRAAVDARLTDASTDADRVADLVGT